MDKKAKLEKLKKEIEEDRTLPLLEANLVFGEGNPESEVFFTGEAPGFHEDKLRRPFVGRAGQLLDKLIEGIGWKRKDVYITNIVKRRPPNNRDPLPEEIEMYKPYLTRQIEVMKPKVIAPLGRFSMNYFLPNAKITRDQGKVFWWESHLVMPIFHPAAALRSTSVLEETQKSFAKLKVVLKKYDEFAQDRKSTLENEKVEKAREESQKTLF